jgi:CheY-like chemotaxis protein
MLHWWRHENPVDTLKVSNEEYALLLFQLNGHARGRRSDEQRRYQRVRYRLRDVKMLIYRQALSNLPYRVRPHDLGVRGIGFLLGFYVHPGTRCETALTTLRGEPVIVPGQIVRCRHLVAKAHELGAEFEYEICVNDFIADPAASAAAAAEKKVVRFKGRILYVDDTVEDRDLVAFLGQELGVTTETASSAEEAVAQVPAGQFDLVLLKAYRCTAAGGAWPKTLRAAGYPGPIAAVSSPADWGEESARQVDCLPEGSECVLASPITVERLADLFRGFLPTQDGHASADMLLSSRWSNVRMRPLILKFAERLEARVRKLQELLAAGDQAAFHLACEQLMGSAESYGYEQVSATLRDLRALTVEAAIPGELPSQLAELKRLCAAARRGAH